MVGKMEGVYTRWFTHVLDLLLMCAQQGRCRLWHVVLKLLTTMPLMHILTRFNKLAQLQSSCERLRSR